MAGPLRCRVDHLLPALRGHPSRQCRDRHAGRGCGRDEGGPVGRQSIVYFDFVTVGAVQAPARSTKISSVVHSLG